MVTCPRCGNDADYLTDDAFSLIRCEFCGDDIDAADLVPVEDVDRTNQPPRISYVAQVA